LRITNRAMQLPLRGPGYEIICPECKANYANEGITGKYTVSCPACGYAWRIDDNGRPKTKALAKLLPLIL